MLYSGNRKLGIVAIGTPDMNPLYSGNIAIDSQINILTSTSLSPSSLISIASSGSQIELDWPKPCEYFSPTILASEFPVELKGVNEIGISIPYIIESGVSGYNIIQNILNTPTGSSLTINNFYDGFDSNKNYKFEIEEKSISGGLTYIAGNLILLNPNLPTFFNLIPKPVGGFFLRSSGQNHDLFFISNTDGVIYRVNSLTTNQSTTYRVNNTIHICGGNI